MRIVVHHAQISPAAQFFERASRGSVLGVPGGPGVTKTVPCEADITISSVAREACANTRCLRFAVSSAIDLRVKGLNAAADYIRTIALAPTTGAQVATAAAGAQADLSRALTQMYSAAVTATELPVRLRITDAELRERAAEANLRASSEAQHDRVQAALGASSALGNIASAAVNGLHAQTGINANESL